MHLDDEDFGSCPCGSAWFVLEVPDEAVGDCRPAVCIDEDGNINGFAGKLVCIECEQDWNPELRFRRTRSHLRIVD